MPKQSTHTTIKNKYEQVLWYLDTGCYEINPVQDELEFDLLVYFEKIGLADIYQTENTTHYKINNAGKASLKLLYR